jgi:hypothetical protein
MIFSLPELLSLLGLLVAVGGIGITAIVNIWRKVIANADSLAEFKLKVAQEYVGAHRLADMEQKMLLSEERLHSTLGNLSSRIDRLLERMEKVSK